MTSARTLPLSLSPRSGSFGESFASYADRLAAHLDVPLISLLDRTGLANERDTARMPTGYGIVLTPRQVETFAYVARISEGEIRKLMVSRYDGTAVDLGSVDPSRPDSVRLSAMRQWAYFTGSHVCPRCLADSGGAWRVAWKLPWSFACTVHENLLLDTCPSCARRVAVGRQDGRSSPAFPTLVPEPVRCRNAVPGDGSRRRRGPCGYALDEAETLPLGSEWTRLLDVQVRLDEALEAGPQNIGGRAVPAAEYFASLRHLCRLILYWGKSEDLDELPFAVRTAFEVATAPVKDEPLSRAGVNRVGPPNSAALMAAIAPVAVTMLDAGGLDELSASFEPFVRRMYERPRRVQNLHRFFEHSPTLSEAFAVCLQPHRKLAHRLSRRSPPASEPLRSCGERRSSRPLTSEHVPQLFWEAAFRGEFEALLPSIWATHARRFCSIALARLLDGFTSWRGATESVGLPWVAQNVTRKAVILLNRTGAADEFDARIRSFAVRLAGSTNAPVNYGLRRHLLADLTDLDPDAWNRICTDTGAHPGRDGVRRRHAATWLWCHLTCGEYPFAPAFPTNGVINARDKYTAFVRGALAQVEEPLIAYGLCLLNQRTGRSGPGIQQNNPLTA